MSLRSNERMRARKSPRASSIALTRLPTRLVIRNTPARIFSARSAISAGFARSFVAIRRCAWPSIAISGVRDSWDILLMKLRCSVASVRSISRERARISAWFESRLRESASPDPLDRALQRELAAWATLEADHRSACRWLDQWSGPTEVKEHLAWRL